MNKIFISTLLALFPALALASSGSSLSFAPPAGDYSVVFLGNVFGIVDGVLHGTGSQIMGNMFGVFNAAVLALGGIVIMYTLMVSTVNTAHEGQMLGQKWSSIWVPVRATLGLALLIPKASGYCLMQIFVMWVCVQGVGAADKIWDSALNYLNRGGVIVQAQMNPIDMVTGGANSDVLTGASTILSGQTCMIGLQQILTTQLKGYQNSLSHSSGPCAGTPTGPMQTFCNATIPDFVGSVNVVSVQSANPNQTTPYLVSMPNFDSTSPFYMLNGICGNIQWQPFSTSQMESVQNISGLSTGDMQTAKMSRAIAIQQMYQDLTDIAQVAVNNDPQLTPPTGSSPSPIGSNVVVAPSENNYASTVAQEQFGVPYMSSGIPCTIPSTSCVTWGTDPTSGTSAPIYNGTEFQNAIADYNGIMAPTLNLYSQSQDSDTANKQRAFIQAATNQGWIMAGSYFFQLAQLNASTESAQPKNTTNNQLIDTQSGLGNSTFNVTTPSSAFNNNSCVGQYANLCVWLQSNPEQINNLVSLINGANFLTAPLPTPTFDNTTHNANSGPAASTIFGYINNSVMVQLPGQPGMSAPQFGVNFRLSPEAAVFKLPSLQFPCGKVTITFFSFCLGQLMGDIFYNDMLVPLWNFLIAIFITVINAMFMLFLSLPLYGMAIIFKFGVSFIQQPNVNPVLALAAMGVNYINFANDLWIFLTSLAIVGIIIPIFGLFVLPLLAMTMPLLVAWLGTMVAIGFLTAYYIPLLPYMIFTFGAIAWLMAVVEAMVAAPIVALGITHPEGEGPFGKGEQAIMILMNVFLRPAMMIIGYIAGIIVSYVSVWIINAGFGNVITFITGPPGSGTFKVTSSFNPSNPGADVTTGYTGWAGVYGYFFSILIYTTMYVTVVQKAFTLITILPDKVLRWIGGQPESIGQESASWGDEAKQQVKDAGKATTTASGQMDKQATGYAMKAAKAMKGQGSASSTGSSSTQSSAE